MPLLSAFPHLRENYFAFLSDLRNIGASFFVGGESRRDVSRVYPTW